MIDFSLPDDLTMLRDKVAAFVNDEIVPLERDPRQDPHGPAEELRHEMFQLARETKLLSPHGAREWGGARPRPSRYGDRLRSRRMVAVGTARAQHSGPGRRQYQPAESGCDPAQKERWLGPFVRGEICTVFSMTERDGGAGSDPMLMKTNARSGSMKTISLRAYSWDHSWFVLMNQRDIERL